MDIDTDEVRKMEVMSDFLDDLNESQRRAVEYIDGPSLVIAGAGSGKTRVLTYKIAYLLTQGYSPWEIMALTFTNKAAKEMKERIIRLVGEEAHFLRMGTFHSVFSHILRREAERLGYEPNFTIYDETDSRSLCKSLVKELNLDDKVYRATEVHNRISWAKNSLIGPAEYGLHHELVQRDESTKMPQMGLLYNLYQERCRKSNAMDFDDLLFNTYLLFKNNKDVQEKYANGFRFFLVDEYQDTNYAQQQIILQLASAHKHVCVVGDDAQSIYGFRGANIDNILDFQQQYGGAQLFKLERNYRSTKRIVEAANSLIHKNERQIHKDVYSQNDDGDNLSLSQLSSDREEAMYVCKDIRRKMREHGLKFSDFAILYRTNAQSRPFEDQMLKDGTPYRVYGGTSFYQRKEIKDIVAYLRLVANPNDEEAFKRIINYPARGIGDVTINKLLKAAQDDNVGVWEVVSNIDSQRYAKDFNKGVAGKVRGFCQLIGSFIDKLPTSDAYELGKEIIEKSGISKELYASAEPEFLSRQENMEEFLSSMHDFVSDAREEGEAVGLLDFLHEVALLSDRDKEEDSPQVTLMTIHSAKGLEFPCVYIVGMEENIFPSSQCTDSRRKLEEERRLLYVAITRAERYCVLTYSKTRFRYGRQEFFAPSRFLRDIDRKLINMDSGVGYSRQPAFFQHRVTESLRPVRSTTSEPTHGEKTTKSAAGYSVGDMVQHMRFGIGKILELIGEGDSLKAIVEFQNAGTKKLLMKYAQLNKV